MSDKQEQMPAKQENGAMKFYKINPEGFGDEDRHGIWARREDCETLLRQRAELVGALKLAIRQNSHDMVMTGDEIRRCENALRAGGGE